MPENPFLKFQQYVSKPPRNSVDLSHRYNGTFGFGTLYPVLCLEVDSGDTFSIESAFGLKFLPMPFPVQTPMRATMHFYYVRNRTMWKDYEDFIYGNKSADTIPHPYIQTTDRDFFKTGSLADYLDVPTTVTYDGLSSVLIAPMYGINYNTAPVGTFSQVGNTNATFNAGSVGSQSNANIYITDPRAFAAQIIDPVSPGSSLYGHGMMLRQLRVASPSSYSSAGVVLGWLYGGFDSFPNIDSNGRFKFTLQGAQIRVAPGTGITPASELTVGAFAHKKNTDIDSCVFLGLCPVYSATGFTVGSNAIEITCHDLTFGLDDIPDDYEVFFMVGQTAEQSSKYALVYSITQNTNFANINILGTSMQLTVPFSNSNDLSNPDSPNPFLGVTPAVGLNALPFRAYEMIYNAYYRNERLEPLLIDGVPEYNKYCPNMDSGADTYPYHLYKRNWEADFLTSALPTPQQGIAPVVGVAGLTDVQIQDPETQNIYNFHADIDPDDGETIVGGSFHNPDASLAARRTAQDIVTAGFTINDFRNVNALQRWLENNIRRGLKYRDQVLANTGVKVKYDELDMPEFIGGFSRPVTVSSITQTAPGGDGLGDYAGQANCFGQSKHRISHYCDEKGFIMGILCVTPQPVYSQLLPKHFLKRTALDYHHPVLNHIGMQPICYDEVCPVQVFASNPSQTSSGIKLTDVFGYQRPYYDLLQHVDTVHGQMRTTMRNYVMNRTFSDVPELGADFIHVDPAQLNQVFNFTSENEDVIMGEIFFRIYAKRTVSLFGQPKIV